MREYQPSFSGEFEKQPQPLPSDLIEKREQFRREGLEEWLKGEAHQAFYEKLDEAEREQFYKMDYKAKDKYFKQNRFRKKPQ
jgi:hypothetical protein